MSLTWRCPFPLKLNRRSTQTWVLAQTLNIYIYRFQNVFLRCPTPKLHRLLQVGGWVDGPAPDHPEKNTHAKKPRQRLGKTDGLSNKQTGKRKITQNSIEVDAETKVSTRKTEEKLDGINISTCPKNIIKVWHNATQNLLLLEWKFQLSF